MLSIVKRLEDADNLPSMPHTLSRVLEDLDSDSSSAQTLEKIIRDDPVLVAKMLCIANSPYYGLTTKVNSISRAVVVLGFEEIRGIVIGLSLNGIFSTDLGFKEFDIKDLWLHSIGVAKASKMLAEHISGLEADELFTAGILHDLGRFLLCLYFAPELKEILELKQREGLTLYDAEERYGLTHSEAGAYLAKKWDLSDMLVNIIHYHHRPNRAGSHILASSVVFLADELCQKIKFGWNMEGEVDRVLVPKGLGLDSDVIKEIAVDLREKKNQIKAIWGDILSV